MFILPNMVAVSLFTIWPAISGLHESFYRSIEGQPTRFAGLQNYKTVLTSTDFWSAVTNTVEFVVGFVIATLVLATLIALLLERQSYGRNLLRASVYVPVLISPVVVGILWNWLLQPNTGVVDALLQRLGLGQPGWLVSPHLAMGTVIFVELWATLGFYVLIIVGGLQAIDRTMFEAGRVDGASEWQQIRHITLPAIRPTLLVVIILSMTTAFQAFEFLYTLTGGGPVGGTTLIIQYIYDHAFIPPVNYGIATAVSVLLFGVLLVLTLIGIAVGRRRDAV